MVLNLAAAMTVSMTVEFSAPLLLDVPFTIAGTIADDTGRDVLATGVISQAGRTTSISSARFRKVATDRFMTIADQLNC